MVFHESVRRTHMAVDSSSLFFFWMLQVVCDTFPFQTLLRKALQEVRRVPNKTQHPQTGPPPSFHRHAFSVVVCLSAGGGLRSSVLLFVSRQGGVSDLPRFCLFYIAYGLQLISLVLSGLADVPPEVEEVVKKVECWCAVTLFNWLFILLYITGSPSVPSALVLYTHSTVSISSPVEPGSRSSMSQ